MSEDYDSLTEAEEEAWDTTYEPDEEAEDAGEELEDGEAAALDLQGPDDEDEMPEDVTDYDAEELPT